MAADESPKKFKQTLIYLAAGVGFAASLAGLFADGRSALDSITEESIPADILELCDSLDVILIGSGEPALPKSCRTSQKDLLNNSIRAAKLLESGKANGNRQQDKEALSILKKRLQENLQDGAYWYLLSKASYFTGAGLSEVKKYALLAQANCESWSAPDNLLGNYEFKNGRFAEAEVYYRTALTKTSGYTVPRFNMALIAMQNRQYQEAILALDTLIADRANHRNAHFLRAQAKSQLGQVETAVSDIRIAIEQDKANGNAVIIHGQLLEKLGNKAEANQEYCKAAALGIAAARQLCKSEEAR
jgi:Flp pilus assembly protein TadD